MAIKKLFFLLPNIARDDPIEVGTRVVRCAVEGWSQNEVQGYLTDFDPEARLLKVQIEDQARPVVLRFNQVKRLKVYALPGCDVEFHPSGLSDDAAGSDVRSFAVHLRDGALYTGICHVYHKLAYGLWLFPKSSLEDDPYRVFMPKSGITRFESRDAHNDLLSDSDFGATVLGDVSAEASPAPAASPTWVATVEQLQQALKRQATLQPVPIGEALLGLGKITPEQLNQALEEQKSQGAVPLGQLLVERGLLTQADLQIALARKMGYPFVDVAQFPLDVSVLRRVPLAMAMRLKVLPLVELRSSLVVVMADPMQFRVIEELEFTTQRKVVPVVASAEELLARIVKAYRELGLGDAPLAPRVPSGRPTAEGVAQSRMAALALAVELSGHAKEHSEDEAPLEQSDNTLVKLINSMITEAYYQQASDIHIEPYPGRAKVVIRFRVDGEMRPYLELPASYRNALVARIKIMCDLDISERRKPQDGKINFAKFGGLALELRVVTLPTAHGLEDVVMRLLSSSEPLPLDALHLSPSNLAAFEHIVARPYGLFLCVGPTGSGKTTTLHAALKQINTPQRKVWTAEDPIEITQRGLRQIQVNSRIGWTFAAALRSLLRADPDVIMVGEIRDHETAEMAIEASLTGHLVLSTLHTNSAAETVVRLIDLGVDPFSFADSLQGILAQRLVRRWCQACVRPEPLSQARLQELMHDYQTQLPADHPLRDDHALQQDWQQRFASSPQAPLTMAHAPGCSQCADTGYRGRLALHELLSNSGALRQLIQQRARPQDLQTTAIAEGMRTLRQDGIEKVLQGLTSLAEVRANSNV